MNKFNFLSQYLLIIPLHHSILCLFFSLAVGGTYGLYLVGEISYLDMICQRHLINLSVARFPRCLKFIKNKGVLDTTSIWVFSRDHLNSCPIIVDYSSFFIHNFRLSVPCWMWVWGKYSPKNTVGRYRSCFGNFLLSPIYWRDFWYSSFSVLYPCGIEVVEDGSTYEIDPQIPILLLCKIRCLVSSQIATFWIHLCDLSTSTSTWFFVDTLRLPKFMPPIFPFSRKRILL